MILGRVTPPYLPGKMRAYNRIKKDGETPLGWRGGGLEGWREKKIEQEAKEQEKNDRRQSMLLTCRP